MKKRYLVITTIIMTSFLTAFNSQKDNVNIDDTVKMETTYWDDVTFTRDIYEYDSNGNLLKKYFCNEDSFSLAYEYRYDENNNQIEEIFYADDGIEINQSMYDSSGKKVKEVFNNGEDGYIEYEYDSEGNLIKDMIYNSGGSLSDINSYEYDSNGHVIVKEEYNCRTETVQIRTEWIYDEDGHMLGMKYDGTDSSHYRAFKGTYNSADNSVKLVFADDPSGEDGYCIVQYDNNNRLIRETSYDSNNNVMMTTEYCYEYGQSEICGRWIADQNVDQYPDELLLFDEGIGVGDGFSLQWAVSNDIITFIIDDDLTLNRKYNYEVKDGVLTLDGFKYHR